MTYAARLQSCVARIDAIDSALAALADEVSGEVSPTEESGEVVARALRTIRVMRADAVAVRMALCIAYMQVTEGEDTP